jgi:cytochrome c553
MKSRPHRVLVQIIWLAVLASAIAPVNAQSISAGEHKHGFCASCHGINGRSFKVNYPILAGQAAPYILHELQDFKDGRRSDPVMDAIVPQLSDEDMRDLAVFFAASEPYSSPSHSDPVKANRGRKLAEVAQCASCHLGGIDSGGGGIPRIHGQHWNYLVKQLKDFRAGTRANDGGVMRAIAQSMTDSDIEDLAAYFASARFDSGKRIRQ